MRIHARDRRMWFAVNFGRGYFKSPPLVSPLIAIGLVAPVAILAMICLFSISHEAAGIALAVTPIVAASDRIQDLTRQIDQKMNEYEAIKKKAQDESRLLTPEERAQCAALQKEVLQMTNERELEQDEIEVRESVNRSARQPIRPNPQPTEDELQRRYPGLPDKNLRYSSLAPFLLDVIDAHPSRNGRYSEKLQANIRAASGMGIDVPSDGGFAVQPDQSSRLIEPLFGSTGDRILAGLSNTTVTGNGISFNAVDETDRSSTTWGGIATYWLGEGVDITDSHPKLRKVELRLKKVAGLLYLTDELLEDSPAMAQRVESGFRGAIRKALVRAVTRGTGAGQPLGMLTSDAKVKITKETGQLAATINTDNVLKMYEALDPDAVNPVWLYNKTCFKQLFQCQVALGTAGALVNVPGGGLAARPNETLLGIPMIQVPCLPVLGTEGDLMLVDLAQYEFIQKGGAQVAYSIHVKFVSDQMAMRITYRCDGRPAVVSSTTLEDGSTTVSPIVTLETRS